MQGIVSYLKFLVKTRIVSPVRSLLVRLFGGRMSILEWENRILIINLEALGDLVVFTSVLKHYKKRFPDKQIYLLIKKGFGIEEIFKDTLVDEVITLDYKKFSGNPFYGASIIKALRQIGFRKVINHDFSAAEIHGKYIATSLGAAEVIGYEGLGIEFARPFDIQQVRNMRVVVEKLHPRYTKIVPSIDAMRGIVRELPGVIRHYAATYEGATGFREDDYSTTLPISRSVATQRDALSFFGLTAKRYVILGINASVPYKRWPLSRFVKIAQFFAEKDFDVVIVGSTREISLSEEFDEFAGVKLINTVGQTSIHDLIQLVHGAGYVVTNDSSLVHFAVAFKVPSVCVIGGGQFGMFSNYGYKDLNRWVYKETPCYGDNWECGREAAPETPSPCIAAVETEDVLKETVSLFEYVKKMGKDTSIYTPELFLLGSEFPAQAWDESKTVKVLYAGIQSENYNPSRSPSFEYTNFYLTLKAMKGVSVIEYPYEPIVGMGKKKFNEKLLEFIQREKPDVFFAFMFSDELDTQTLDAIKQMTTSVAWFADDHWRLWNYSRQYAPHFTWTITTWSGGPHAYRKYGVQNVIRSQWAANHLLWKPVNVKQDIDVSFVGQYNPARAEIIRRLREAGIDVYVRGWGWPEGRASHEEVLHIISRSKINLNLSAPPSRFTSKFLARLFLRRSIDSIDVSFSIIDNGRSWHNMGRPQIKARPFEILACNAFLISSFADDIDAYYADGKEAVYYRGGADDLIQKVKEYLPKDEERKKIAEAGYERTIREHTYENRFRGIFTIIGINYEE